MCVCVWCVCVWCVCVCEIVLTFKIILKRFQESNTWTKEVSYVSAVDQQRYMGKGVDSEEGIGEGYQCFGRENVELDIGYMYSPSMLLC